MQAQCILLFYLNKYVCFENINDSGVLTFLLHVVSD